MCLSVHTYTSPACDCIIYSDMKQLNTTNPACVLLLHSRTGVGEGYIGREKGVRGREREVHERERVRRAI